MMLGLVLSFMFLGGVLSHSWLSCPPSFHTMPTRGGFFDGPCERWTSRGGNTKVKAGDRLKVGWTSNNHAGGYVRLALLPEGQHTSNKNFEQNVMKVVCYGKDQRPGGSRYGDCIHPCNSRPGCEYQSDISDVERYDTTITIPTNLKDGVYILQYVGLVGNAVKPYYSCAKLTVTGGNPGMKCKSDSPPIMYQCHKSGGPARSKITTGIKRGEFCYHKNKMGDVDDRIREVPINVDCDARITCANSISGKKCFAEPGMKTIKDAWNPKQVCGDVKPPPPPTCDDKKQNQGEEDVDCGGPCKPCPTAGPNTGQYHSKIDHKITQWGSGTIKIYISKDVPRDWQLTVQYSVPIKIGAIWGGGRKSGQNEGGNIIHFRRNSWNKLPKKGDVISIGFNSVKGRNEELTPLTMLFEIDDASVVKRHIGSLGPNPHNKCGETRCRQGYECITEAESPCKSRDCIKQYCQEM